MLVQTSCKLASRGRNLPFVNLQAFSLQTEKKGPRELVSKPTVRTLVSYAIGVSPANSSVVIWEVTPLFAEWVSSDDNIFFQSSILDNESLVLELGAGISGLIALSLAPKVKRYVATDQDYVLKLLRENIARNYDPAASQPKRQSARRNRRTETRASGTSTIDVIQLDWETSSTSSLYTQTTLTADQDHVTAVIVADCVYNEALIQPLVETCSDVCKLAPEGKPTLCVVVQQLRSPDVFEHWLKAFHSRFRVWRVPDELLSEELKVKNGFAMHVGILKDEEKSNQ
jgi:hypothetical protein